MTVAVTVLVVLVVGGGVLVTRIGLFKVLREALAELRKASRGNQK